MSRPTLNRARSIFRLNKTILLRHLQKGRVLFSKRNLLYTNTCLGVVTAVSGDLIQQNYQRLINDENRRWNPKRSGKMATVGFVFGTCSHFWYIILEKILPGHSIKALVTKICLDQFIYSPFCISIFLVIVGILEQRGLGPLKEDFKETGVLMFITDMVIWTPAQAVNFYFVPVKYRVLYDSTVSLIVDTFYSYLRFERDTVSKKKKSDFQMDKGIVSKAVIAKS